MRFDNNRTRPIDTIVVNQYRPGVNGTFVHICVCTVMYMRERYGFKTS